MIFPILLALSGLPASVRAADDALSRRISMGVGKSIILDLPRDASEIFVGNPKVANAVVRSPRKIYIIGIDGGQTTIFALDAAGRQIVTVDISIGRDIQELDRILKSAVPRANIALRTVNDTIILSGLVDSARDAQQALDIAAGFLSQGNGASNGRIVNSLTIRGQDQVMLKVTIAEVKRQVMKQLGISNISASGNWGRLDLSNPFGLGSGVPPNSIAANGNITATLQAFERYGVARILAEPTVTAVSGESAKFTAGGEIPIPSGQNCTIDPATNRNNCSSTVTFRPYGVTLNFTPVVLSEGRIMLRVATEVVDIDPTQTYSFGNTSIAGFLTRKNETTVELPSGASIASAGLIQTRSRQVINGMPGLMNLPVLGALFRSRDYQREESELMIVVTPVLAKPTQPGELNRPTDHLADSSDPQAWLLGRMNRLYSSPAGNRIEGFKGRVGFIND
jgi:pilus assembly protein CpaC